ncbi:putative sterile alpha motif domain-containing protein 3-like [Scophthalmus maximus]|uniref:Putative sterile alpha motif domain-containing protein 3-like n=1 Tax=Scophthalmus maximus TaxID=52904 RepID=A0A2U9CNV8_SCOMX|nr:putative sterile alpha motif domain-containing protein 3-like [Scophthalmus maximus]
MAHTFAIRRQEVVNQEPSIKFFQDRWPALFQKNEDSRAGLAETELEQLTMAVFVIRKEGEGLQEPPEDIGIVIEGVEDSRAGLAETELEQLTMAVFVIRKEGEGLQEPPEDIGIVIEVPETLYNRGQSSRLVRPKMVLQSPGGMRLKELNRREQQPVISKVEVPTKGVYTYGGAKKHRHGENV